MKINPSQTVGQIAVNLKESIPVFEKYKINYYNQGSRSLKDACYLAGVPLEGVSLELEALVPSPGEWYLEEKDWRNEPMGEVADHIVKTHHPYVRKQLDRIEKILEDLVRPSLSPVPEIPLVRSFFMDMSRDLRIHLRQEEEVVFPYLVEAEIAMERGAPLPSTFKGYNAITHPIRMLQDDHGMMGNEWMKIEELTNGFTAPDDASPLLKELYQAFRELEKDNRKHMHLENNILFHRAMQLGLFNNGEKNENLYEKTPHL
jgi:regulator of cell morphogenesis and NO signaling